MSSFLECTKEISFYMKELTLFELDERVFSQLWQLFECSFFYLIEYFFIPTAIFYPYCEGCIFFYIPDIVSRCAKIYPQWFTFSFVRKNNYKDKQRNKHTFETKEKEKQTETETILKFCSWSDSCSDSFSRGNEKQKTKDKR